MLSLEANDPEANHQDKLHATQDEDRNQYHTRIIQLRAKCFSRWGLASTRQRTRPRLNRTVPRPGSHFAFDSLVVLDEDIDYSDEWTNEYERRYEDESVEKCRSFFALFGISTGLTPDSWVYA